MFESHTLNAVGMAKVQTAREKFELLLKDLSLIIPSNREMAIVKTKLQEACFFAVRAVSVEIENQQT